MASLLGNAQAPAKLPAVAMVLEKEAIQNINW